jgi:hypothetical protein
VLGVHAGHSEAEVFWTEFLRGLADRGLRGVKLVIADDHKGLRAAARRVFNATQQRCRMGPLKKVHLSDSMHLLEGEEGSADVAAAGARAAGVFRLRVSARSGPR